MELFVFVRVSSSSSNARIGENMRGEQGEGGGLRIPIASILLACSNIKMAVGYVEIEANEVRYRHLLVLEIKLAGVHVLGADGVLHGVS